MDKEKYILVGVSLDKNDKVKESLDELSELLKTAGGETLDKVYQNLKAYENATYLGKGKILELKEYVESLGATGIICDDELSPMQLKNLSDMLECKVLDRTMLILDIFAAHATTSEGKNQVEMAQLKYRSQRLTGMGTSLSRLGGGIGTRGPGESKLEIDRRIIQKRISFLRKEIENIEKIRDNNRKKRKRNHIPVVSIVGYTNAGKSTLLNKITGANILAEDKLFATLDPTTRKLKMESGEEILITDTVGFINKLPHHLIDAFKSTLEEAAYSDIILHVVDSSDENMSLHMDTVYKTLYELNIIGKPIITLMNKADISTIETPIDNKAEKTIKISAKTGFGLDKALDEIQELLNSKRQHVNTIIPYSKAGILDKIRREGNLLSEEYMEDGIKIEAYIPYKIQI